MLTADECGAVLGCRSLFQSRFPYSFIQRGREGLNEDGRSIGRVAIETCQGTVEQASTGETV